MVRSEPVTRLAWATVRGVFVAMRKMGKERAERLARRIVRTVGPLIPENRVAVANIAAAFPEKSAAERRAILKGCWDNLAKTFVEFVFLEEIAGFDNEHRERNYFTISGDEYFDKLRDEGKPAVIFTAHLANWELLAVAARAFRMKSVIPFHAPSNSMFGKDLLNRRAALMGTLVSNTRGGVFEIAAEMEKGAVLGTLIDQRLNDGVVVNFLGRPAFANPMAARFARQFDCPVHGARSIRLPNGRPHLEMTPEIEMPRDADGLIDVDGATARMTEVVEGWVREHPEQWFWVHNRWRM